MSKKKTFKELKEIYNKIPKNTPYCYTPDIEKNTEAKEKGEYGVFYIKPCEYYENLDGLQGRCKLYDCEVIDQVKGCGLNSKW